MPKRAATPALSKPRSTTRATVQERIERQRNRLTDLDERIGRLMTARADAQEKLSELLNLQHRIYS